MLEVLRKDYVRTARAKGLSERMVVLAHAMKNSLIPVVTVLGPLFAALLTGTFVTVFSFTCTIPNLYSLLIKGEPPTSCKAGSLIGRNWRSFIPASWLLLF